MLAGRRDPSRRVAIGRGSSRAHFLAIIFLAIGFLDSFRFLDRKKSMQLCFSIADRHFFLVGHDSLQGQIQEFKKKTEGGGGGALFYNFRREFYNRNF